MNRQEFKIWVAALQTYFPKYNLLPTPEAKELWYRELTDLSADVATAVLRKWVATEKWPPSIAEIRASACDMVNGPASNWGDGWYEVKRAIERYGIFQPGKVKATVSPATWSAIERIGWEDICNSENPEALRAQFRQVYEVMAARERQNLLIAPSTREMIAQVAGGLALIGGGE